MKDTSVPLVRSQVGLHETEETLIISKSENSNLRKCPFCRELIQNDALKCKYCSSVLVPIGDNFANIARTNALSNNVQIVTNTQNSELLARRHPEHTITPPDDANAMLGHGWGVLVLSFIFFSLAANSFGDEALGASVLGAIIVAPWSVWILSKTYSNKILPATALIVTTLGFLGALQM